MTDCVVAVVSKISSFVMLGTSTNSRETNLNLWKEKPDRRERKKVRPCNHRSFRSPPVGRIFHRAAISLADRGRTGLAASEGRRPWVCCSSGVRKPVDNFRPAFTSMRKPWRGCRRNTRKRIARIATQINFWLPREATLVDAIPSKDWIENQG